MACYSEAIFFNDLAKPFIPLFYKFVDITITVRKKLYLIYFYLLHSNRLYETQTVHFVLYWLLPFQCESLKCMLSDRICMTY